MCVYVCAGACVGARLCMCVCVSVCGWEEWLLRAPHCLDGGPSVLTTVGSMCLHHWLMADGGQYKELRSVHNHNLKDLHGEFMQAHSDTSGVRLCIWGAWLVLLSTTGFIGHKKKS